MGFPPKLLGVPAHKLWSAIVDEVRLLPEREGEGQA